MPDIMRFYDFEDFLSDLLESGYSYNYFGNNLISDLTYIFSERAIIPIFPRVVLFWTERKRLKKSSKMNFSSIWRFVPLFLFLLMI